MSELLDSLIEKIEKRARADDPTAVEQAARLAEQYPDAPKVWCLLAYAHARRGNIAEAIADMTRAIDLSPPQPGMFFDRGRYELKRANYRQAIDDFDKALTLCEQQRDEYYRESLHFLRADALLRLGRRTEAKADLAHVRDDFALWTTELRTKDALLAECALR